MPDPIQPQFWILPAEHFGIAKAIDGHLDIGGLRIPYWERPNGDVHVYVRRTSKDLSIMEIHIAHHDGLAQEELDQLNDEIDDEPARALEHEDFFHPEDIVP